ncbi:MAG: hypothetical protein Q9217_002143 [Psora testacea]
MSDQDALTPRVILFRHAGAKQVSLAATRLVGAGKLLDPLCLAHVFVSPRVRAVRTFELLLPPSSGVVAGKVTYTEDIAEWNYGDYEGLKDQEIRLLRKQRGLDLERRWNIWSDGCEGGESRQQVTERLDRLILQIKEIQKPYMRGEKPVDVLVLIYLARKLQEQRRQRAGLPRRRGASA